MPKPFWVILETGDALNLERATGLEIEGSIGRSATARVYATDDMSDETYSHGWAIADCVDRTEAAAFIRRLLERQAEGAALVTVAAVLANVKASSVESAAPPLTRAEEAEEAARRG